MHTILNKVFFGVHQVVKVDESHFGFNHPELCKVTRRVAIFGSEGWPEGVNLPQGRCSKLAFKLSAHGKASHLAEEVVAIVHLSVLVFLQVVQLFRCNLEHFACPFCIASSDDGRMEIEETMVVKILMDGNGHIMAYTHHSSESVGAQTKVRMLAHILKGLPLLLHGIVATTCAQELQVGALYFRVLTLSLTLYQFTRCAYACSSCDLLEQIGIHRCWVDNHLHVIDGRTVVQSDEIHHLTAAVSSHPALYVYLRTEVGALKYVHNLCSTNFIH